MNKNKILSGGGKNLTGGGKWGWRGREVGGEGEGSGVKGGVKWGKRGREVGVGYPPVHPLIIRLKLEIDHHMSLRMQRVFPFGVKYA